MIFLQYLFYFERRRSRAARQRRTEQRLVLGGALGSDLGSRASDRWPRPAAQLEGYFGCGVLSANTISANQRNPALSGINLRMKSLLGKTSHGQIVAYPPKPAWCNWSRVRVDLTSLPCTYQATYFPIRSVSILTVSPTCKAFHLTRSSSKFWQRALFRVACFGV